jgi:putative transposase
MARLPRHIAPGTATHVTQRGNNKSRTFQCADDYQRYLAILENAGRRFGCAIHCYVLMTNHVHLLVTPDDDHAISRMMQMIGRYYVRYVNTRYHRTGTLWEGRFKSSVVECDRHLLTCYRYIELNPVRAELADAPGRYRWSSHGHNAWGITEMRVTPHRLYDALGATPRDRQAAYRALFRNLVEERTLDLIRRSTKRGAPLGDNQFVERIQLGRHQGLLPHAGGSGVGPAPL